MAEQAPAIQSKRLLVVALILAGVVVLIYNVHVNQVRKAGRGEMVQLLKFRRDMDSGEVITKKDIRVMEVDRLVSVGLGKVVPNRDLDFLVGRVLKESARKDDWVKYGHVTRVGKSGPAGKLEEGMVAVSLELDPRNALGDILRVYDRVNIRAKLSVNRKQLETFRVISGVRVMAVGGRGESGDAMATGARARMGRAPRSYRSITIEIREEESLRLANVLSHRAGSITIELCRFGLEARPGDGKINPKLESLTKYASTREMEGSR